MKAILDFHEIQPFNFKTFIKFKDFYDRLFTSGSMSFRFAYY